MFSQIQAYITVAIGVVLAILVGALYFLYSSNQSLKSDLQTQTQNVKNLTDTLDAKQKLIDRQGEVQLQMAVELNKRIQAINTTVTVIQQTPVDPTEKVVSPVLKSTLKAIATSRQKEQPK